MFRRDPGLAALTVVLALTMFGCSEGPAETPDAGSASEPAAPSGSRPARTLALPGQELPPGHPPAGGGSSELVWDLPEGWVELPPASNMRRAQYRVPGAGGEGECIVYYFGPGQGGDAMSNAVRWARQFKQPDGSDSTDAMRLSTVEGARQTVQLVEVTGTYDGGMTMTDAPAESKTGYMLLGSIVAGPDANWFFKFTGPEPTVLAQREAFVDMMKSIRPGA